mmetsp:Transcript_7779/g.23029  ORF Transcript_7779/g.23029 Transcript_7779/m.23029 type:complete len:132 (-) Transcript_7779:638-1033(-)
MSAAALLPSAAGGGLQAVGAELGLRATVLLEAAEEFREDPELPSGSSIATCDAPCPRTSQAIAAAGRCSTRSAAIACLAPEPESIPELAAAGKRPLPNSQSCEDVAAADPARRQRRRLAPQDYRQMNTGRR